METYTSKINHFITGAVEKNHFCKVFAAKPNLEKEKILGKLFGLIEIKAENQIAVQVADFIINQIKTNYYYQKEINADIEERFEKTLHQTNLGLAQFLEIDKNKINLQDCNIIIALLKNKSLYLSNVGQLIALLIYYQSKNNYQIINIQSETDGLSPPPSSEDRRGTSPFAKATGDKTADGRPWSPVMRDEVNPLKIFSSTISGKINPLDFLFLGTANILNYFSPPKIKNLIISNPLSEISKRFKEELWLLNKKGLSAGLIITLETVKSEALTVNKLKKINFMAAATQDSMKQLMNVEKMTQKLLSPSILGGLKKYSEYLKKIFNNYSKKIQISALNNRPGRAVPSDAVKSRLPVHRKKTGLTKLESLKKILFRLNLIGQMLFNKISALSAAPRWPIWKKATTKFKTLPRLSKLTLIFFIILTVLLSQNIVKTSLIKRKEKTTQKFSQIFTEITQKRDAGKASLIYQDEKNAQTLLIQAKDLIKTLPKKYQNLPEITKFKEEIEQELNKLRHEFIIAEPVLLANFKNLDSQMTPPPLTLKIGEDLYTQNPGNQAIYKLNLASRIITAFQIPEVASGKFILGTVSNNNELLFLNEEQTLFSFNITNNQLQSISLASSSGAKIAALQTFTNRLYLLDTANNQIVRFRKTAAGFTEPNQWLNDQTVNLKNAVDFTVESNIYVLNSTGEIIKLVKGQKVNFGNILIDPPLKSPTKINTEENSKYLYILDPPTQRIVVIDKTGQLVAQYTSPLFDDLKDFAVSESEAKIYVLAGSSVYGIPTKHLE